MMPFTLSGDNPFQPLIAEANNDVEILQSRYENHRLSRNEQQTAKILSADFPGWSLDEILMRLDGPKKLDGFVDPRNCLCIWARPSAQVCDLVALIQTELNSIAPSLWLMPPECLHMTVLEVAHSKTESQIEALVMKLRSSENVRPSDIAAYPRSHPTRLIKPMLSFDSAAVALTFVPDVADEGFSNDNVSYTYHHLRRDIFELVRQANVSVVPRYNVPSAHFTIARYISQDGFLTERDGGAQTVDHSRVRLLIEKIGEINQMLEKEYWPRRGPVQRGGEWLVGQEDLVIRRGRLWYGGGEDVLLD